LASVLPAVKLNAYSRADMVPFSIPGRFYRGNLHTHSTLSDGGLAPDAVALAYQRAGYDFYALTDHFMARYHWPVADTRGQRTNAFTTLIGAELHSGATGAGDPWHILAVGLPLDFAPAGVDESGPALAARAKSAGAFVAIAHPAWSQLTIDDGRALAASADAVEIYNHGSAVENDRGDGLYLLDQLLSEGHRLTAIATDDAHFRTGDSDAFGGFVMVKAESPTPEALLAALKAGHFYASQGPRIEDVRVLDGELRIRCTPVQSITALGGACRTATQLGRAIIEAAFPLERIREVAGARGWSRIAVIDADGRRAWTNPLWLEREALSSAPPGASRRGG